MAKSKSIDERCEFCLTPIPSGLLSDDDERLTEQELDKLWQLFLAIGEVWEIEGVIRFKSSWLEFMRWKTQADPSLPDRYPDYTSEFRNAVRVLEELQTVYKKDAYRMLFLHHGVPLGPPNETRVTRLAHAKWFVVNEFIRILVDPGGFKSFVSDDDRSRVNYRSYVGGSRYNRIARVRAYDPERKGE